MPGHSLCLWVFGATEAERARCLKRGGGLQFIPVKFQNGGSLRVGTS